MINFLNAEFMLAMKCLCLVFKKHQGAMLMGLSIVGRALGIERWG
jgi:hypothetical protein